MNLTIHSFHIQFILSWKSPWIFRKTNINHFIFSKVKKVLEINVIIAINKQLKHLLKQNGT